MISQLRKTVKDTRSLVHVSIGTESRSVMNALYSSGMALIFMV